MTAPLYATGLIPEAFAPWIILAVGFFFGFFLQRGGLGDPRHLTGVFYLKNFTMPKVMFTAVVTAATGLYLLSDFGLLDLSQIKVVPTYLWPQLLGGTILGLGFVISGYCPGTAVVGTGTGRYDAILTIVGIGLGMLLFANVFPSIEGFYGSSEMGRVTLETVSGINHWFIIIGLYGMLYAMYALTKKYKV